MMKKTLGKELLKIGTISYAGTSMDVKIEDALNGGTETWKFQLDLTK